MPRESSALVVVLLASGCGAEGLHAGSQELRSVALAATSAWGTTAGELEVTREQHTATLLPDGSVLLAGGVLGLDTILESAEIYDPRTGMFELLRGEEPGCAGLLAPRVGHTATLLPNGRVLVAGGHDPDDDALPGTEIFDPATRCFVRGPKLQERARANHTATVVPSGRVLLAGGCARTPDSGKAPWLPCMEPFATAELLDETQSKPVGTMSRPRSGHRAALLADTGVLLVGGDRKESGGALVSTSEVFDEALGAFVQGVDTTVARVQHSATLLRDGRVLLAGGAADSGAMGTAPTELFTAGSTDPDVATAEGRQLHTATLLPTGWVLLAGGLESEDDYRPTAVTEIFDPGGVAAAQRMFAGPPLTDARSFHTATLLADATVLIAGGRDGGESHGEHRTAEVLDVSSHGPVSAGSAPQPVANPVAARFGDGSVLLTGVDALGVTGTAQIFDATSGFASGPDLGMHTGHTLTTLSDGRIALIGGTVPNAIVLDTAASTPAGALLTARTGHTATRLPSGKVLVAGGTTDVAAAELFDPISGTFTATGKMRARREHAATRLPSGAVLVTGGLVGADLDGSDDVELFDAALDAFSPLPAGDDGEPLRLQRARAQHTATVLASGLVLVAGGRFSTSTADGIELLDPVARTTTLTDGELAEPRWNHTATLLPSGRVLVAGGQTSGGTGYAAAVELYDPIGRKFRSIGTLDEPRSGHAAILLDSGDVLLVGGSPIDPGSYEIWGESGIDDAWRPELGTDNERRVVAGSRVEQVSGKRLVTTYETSGGATGASAANHPVAIWMPFDGAPSFGGFSGWKATSTTWDVPATAFPGPGFLFAVTSGVSSRGLAITIEPVPNGEACDVGAACASGFCADGTDADLEADMCCASFCSGACMQCGAGGTCEERPADTCTCKSNGDCVHGTICSADGACVAPPADSCSVAGGAGSGGGRCFWAALALLLALLRRRDR